MQDQDGGEGVSFLFAFASAQIGLEQDALGFRGGQTLVERRDGKFEVFFEQSFEFENLSSFLSQGAVHVEGQPQHDLANLISSDEIFEKFQIARLVCALVDG